MKIKVTKDNYPELAFRTFKELKTPLDNSVHMSMGCVGEYGELLQAIDNKDDKNIREEAGDMLWYVACESVKRGYDFKNMIDVAQTLALDKTKNFYIAPFNFDDIIKKSFAYGKIYNYVEVANILIDVCECIIGHTYWRGESFSIENLMRINIEKLYVRYGDKYSDYSALNRDLDAEHKKL